ncbi:hypothetical protein K439DRAFT_1564191 [Ramaria rubella]|nr:hypothetical protein K439DRAFT_1564191 [Ramaria rubella]
MYLSAMLHFDMLLPKTIPTLFDWQNAAVPPRPRASLEVYDVEQGGRSKISTSTASPTTVTPLAVPSATPTGPANDTTDTQATIVTDTPDAATATGVPPGATIILNGMHMAQMSAALIVDLSDVFVRKTLETAPPVARKVNLPKPEGKKRVDAIVRSLMEELLKWKRKENKGALPPLPPTPAAVTEFNQGKSWGPTSNELSIVWGASAYYGWNLAASRIFTDEFIKRQNAGKYQHKNLPEECLKADQMAILFCQKLKFFKNFV